MHTLIMQAYTYYASIHLLCKHTFMNTNTNYASIHLCMHAHMQTYAYAYINIKHICKNTWLLI